MDIFSRDELRPLIEVHTVGCISVSIYMPTFRAGRADVQQNPVRLKNLLREAQERLEKIGLRRAEAHAYLGPAQSLLDDGTFWLDMSDGLVVFLSKDYFRYYRLPTEFTELVVVANRFHIKPLLPMLATDGRFYVLAISQNTVRLLQCTRWGTRRRSASLLKEAIMQVAPEIVLKGVETTPYIDKLITRGIARLEQVCDYIISLHIALEKAQGRRQTGNPYRMRIDIKIPDRSDIVVKRASKASKKGLAGSDQPLTDMALKEEVEPEGSQPIERSPVPRRGIRKEPLLALIRRTFDSARRELEKVVDKQRGDVKTPAQQELQAMVEKIFREQQYGFLRTLDGQEVYFHKNSVLHKHWERLRVGTAVRYTPEMGDKGLQASTVELVDKLGTAEIHNQLHDLPIVK